MLARWLYARAWTADERPSVLFDLATNRLVTAKVLLPGVTVLERLVAAIRDRAAARAFRLLAAAPSPTERAHLERLLAVEPGRRVSELDRLRKSPTDISGGGVVKALDRYTQLRALGADDWAARARAEVDAWPTTKGLGMTPSAHRMLQQTLAQGERDLGQAGDPATDQP